MGSVDCNLILQNPYPTLTQTIDLAEQCQVAVVQCFIVRKYSVFPKVVARKRLKNAKFPKVVAFAQSKLVAQPKVVAFFAQLLLETHYIFLLMIFFGMNYAA